MLYTQINIDNLFRPHIVFNRRVTLVIGESRSSGTSNTKPQAAWVCYGEIASCRLIAKQIIHIEVQPSEDNLGQRV